MKPRTDPPDEMNDAIACPAGCRNGKVWDHFGFIQGFFNDCPTCNGEGCITRAEAERLRESRRADTLEILED